MRLVDDLSRDLRFGARTLGRTPLVTTAAVLSISLGIAATTMVFSVVDAALYRQPPFESAQRLAVVYATRSRTGRETELRRWSWNRFRLLSSTARSFDGLATVSLSVLAFTADAPEPVNAEVASSSYFDVLGVHPIVGRAFTVRDDLPETAQRVVVLGYDTWQRRFAGASSAVGKDLVVNGVRLSIIGVMPQGFRGITGQAELWVPPTVAPLASYGGYLTSDQNFITIIGRLRAGLSLEGARAELRLLASQIDSRFPPRNIEPGAKSSATALSLNDARIDPSSRRALYLLLGGAGCLLLLACVNVAGLELGLAASRRCELAVRTAIGASRPRLVRQLMLEGLLIAMGGGSIGVLVTHLVAGRVALPAAARRGQNFYGAVGEFAVPSVDWRVLVFCVALCGVTVVAFALLPALQATHGDVVMPLKDGGRGSSGPTSLRARHAIVAFETALALMLLTCGGLLAASWHRLDTTETGFDRANVLSFMLRPSEVKFPPAKAALLYDRVLDEIEHVPGVDAATVDGCAPVGTGCASSTLFIMGRPWASPSDAPPVLRHYVGPNHFRVLHTPVLGGRVFTSSDRAGTPRVAVINETAARRFWPDQSPIGQKVWFGGGSNFDRPDSSAEIVGIVGDVAYQPLDEHPVQPDFYTPYTQFTFAARTMLVRTRTDPTTFVPAIRRAVLRANPELALFDVRTMDDRIGDSWNRLGYQTRIVGAFAAAALLMATIGVFAVIANLISDRTHEIGVRMALGATDEQILGIVGAHGMGPAMAGVLVGLLGSIGIGRVLASLLYGVHAFDVVVIAPVVMIVAGAAAVATYLGARRALTISPADALRSS